MKHEIININTRGQSGSPKKKKVRASKWHYTGEWANNRMEGYGVLRQEDGDLYEGQFRNGLKHGTGVEAYKTGETYVG